MTRTQRVRTALSLSLALAVLGGCHEYRAEVEVRPDGSGTRSVVLTPDLDEEMTESGLDGVFAVSPDAGWRREVREDGDVVFRLDRTARTVTDWAAFGGDIRIYSRGDGAAADAARPPEGLANDVSLETGRSAEGRTYTYRERLSWAGLKEELIAMMSGIYAKRAGERLPAGDGTAAAELRGLFRAHLSQTWARIRLTEDEDLFIDTLSVALAPDVAELVARRGLAVDPAALVELAGAVVHDDDDALEGLVDRDLRGVAHAMFTSLRLVVRMPGEIIDTNGTIDGDGAVSWRVDLLDPLDQPVELVARSLLRD